MALATSIVLACGPTTPAGERAPKPRGTLRIAYPLEPENSNPKFITGSGVGEFIWNFNS